MIRSLARKGPLAALNALKQTLWAYRRLLRFAGVCSRSRKGPIGGPQYSQVNASASPRSRLRFPGVYSRARKGPIAGAQYSQANASATPRLRLRFAGLYLGAALLLAPGLLFAAGTASWEMHTYQDFIKGRFDGLSLSRDGRIQLAPKLESLFASDQPSVWSVAQSSDGTLYLGTGHRGRVFRVDGAGKGAVLWTAPQPEIFALTVGPDGSVYAGTSPNGKIYRIHNSDATEYFAPGAKYIWSLAFGKDGALYAGTGDEGKIFRVTAAGKGELYYDSGQSHITCLAFDKDGLLLAGSEPNGTLYRIRAKEKGFVLYDSSLPEIRSIIAAPDGVIYAAALGGSVAQRINSSNPAGSSGSSTPVVTSTTTSITVTDEAAGAQAGVDIKPKPDQIKPPQPPPAVPTAAAAPAEMMGVEKSALYKIYPDNTVETIWNSKEENLYDILLNGDQMFLATDGPGRIYRLNADRKVTLLEQTNEGEVTRLLASGTSLVATTGTLGKVYRLGPAPSPTGSYEAPVHDANTVARWGHLTWRAAGNENSGRITFRTRSGNSSRPDNTWSDWSEPLTIAAGSAISSPNARFIQWKLELAGGDPSLDTVTVSYLPQNAPPTIKSVTVSTQVAAQPANKQQTAQQQPAAATYSITVTDTGDVSASSSTGTPTQMISRGLAQKIYVTWVAEDPDGDPLLYTLYFRGEDEQQWKKLRSDFGENTMMLDGDVFADGRYLFRVVASDKMVNAAGAARETELVSAPVLFDNTPPTVTAAPPRRKGSTAEIDIAAEDAASALRRAEFSLDANAWLPLEAIDGVIDSKAEKFHVSLENLSPGEHLVVIRVYDSAGNAGLTKVIVR